MVSRTTQMGPCNDASTIILAGLAIKKPTHQAPDTGFPAGKRIFRASWEETSGAASQHTSFRMCREQSPRPAEIPRRRPGPCLQ